MNINYQQVNYEKRKHSAHEVTNEIINIDYFFYLQAFLIFKSLLIVKIKNKYKK